MQVSNAFKLMLTIGLSIVALSCAKGVAYPPCFISTITLPPGSIAIEYIDLNKKKSDTQQLGLSPDSPFSFSDDVSQCWEVEFDNPRGWLHVKSHFEKAILGSSPKFTKLMDETVGTGKDAISFCAYESADGSLSVGIYDFATTADLDEEVGSEIAQFSISVIQMK